MTRKIHYAPSGRWGGYNVSCGRYFTDDVYHTRDKNKVTCKWCLKLLAKWKEETK